MHLKNFDDCILKFNRQNRNNLRKIRLILPNIIDKMACKKARDFFGI